MMISEYVSSHRMKSRDRWRPLRREWGRGPRVHIKLCDNYDDTCLVIIVNSLFRMKSRDRWKPLRREWERGPRVHIKLYDNYDDKWICFFTQDEKSRQMEAIKERVRARSQSPHASREGSLISEEEVSKLIIRSCETCFPCATRCGGDKVTLLWFRPCVRGSVHPSVRARTLWTR